MGLAIYRKYRPQTFEDIISQDHIKGTLEREIATEKVAHAYLFSGPRGTGKTSMARIFAKAINCKDKKDGNPCTKCEACEAIRAGSALDVLEIDAASYTGVDNVRDAIIETAKFAPSRLTYKIFIIDEAHMLSNSAWNALLKIMEEPPAHVIFILATTQVNKIPVTILSRCQRFNFSKVPLDILAMRLENIAKQENVKIKRAVLVRIAQLSEGCVRDAESMLEQLLAFGDKEIDEEKASLVLPKSLLSAVLDLFDAVIEKNSAIGLKKIQQISKDGADISYFTLDILEVLRKILLFKAGGKDFAFEGVDKDPALRMTGLANKMEVINVLKMIDIFSKAQQALKNASIPQLPLEVAVVECCLGGDIKTTANQIKVKDGPELDLKKDKEKIEPNIESKNFIPKEIAKTKDEEEAVEVVSAIKTNGSIKVPSIEEVKGRWAELLKNAQGESPTLPFVLSTSHPMEITGDTLHIGVQYPLHRDKLNEDRCRLAVEKLILDLYKSPMRIKGIVAELPKQEIDDGIEDILGVLGGQVIE